MPLVPVPAAANPPGQCQRQRCPVGRAGPSGELATAAPLPLRASFVCWLSDYWALLLMLGDIYIALININYLLSQVNKTLFLLPTHQFDVIWDLCLFLPPVVAPPGNLLLALSSPALPPPSPNLPFLPAALPGAGARGAGSQGHSAECPPEPGCRRASRVNGAARKQHHSPAKPGAERARGGPDAPSSGEGADQIAACVLENICVTEQAAGRLAGFPARLMDGVRSQQLF